MPDSPNSSFIPKRGPTPSRRSNPSKRLYLFTFISYTLFFAALVAAGGMYLYNIYVERQFTKEVTALNSEMSSFSIDNMKRVLEFDNRLSQANSRLNHSVSLPAIFRALESATIDTVMLESLELKRTGDEKYVLSATVQTDSFDSTMFQRDIFKEEEHKQYVSDIKISDVQAGVSESSEETGVVGRSILSFNATLEIPVSAVLYSSIAKEELVLPEVEITEISKTMESSTTGEATSTSVTSSTSEQIVNDETI